MHTTVHRRDVAFKGREVVRQAHRLTNETRQSSGDDAALGILQRCHIVACFQLWLPISRSVSVSKTYLLYVLDRLRCRRLGTNSATSRREVMYIHHTLRGEGRRGVGLVYTILYTRPDGTHLIRLLDFRYPVSPFPLPDTTP